MEFKSSPKIYKNYKSAPPERTLKVLTKCLQPFFLTDMQFRVKSNQYGNAWGTQMTLFGDYDYNIRSNGKGTNPQLAILSSIAEFVERIQSFLPFPIANYLPRLMLKPHIDRNHPDFERWYTFNQQLKKGTGNKTPRFEPFDTTFYKFYDVLEDKNLFLDQSFLISPSNGRAAGNTYEEAIVMAITEIFERYTTRRVFIDHKPLPSISMDQLSNDLQDQIKSIENDDFEVFIKDFSLGQGFPVVGMLFGNSSMGYVLKSSSDLSLNRAVSRCLSDFFQNFESVEHRIKNARMKSQRMIGYYEQFREYLENEVSLDELKANRFSSDSIYSPLELDFLVKDSDEDFAEWEYSHNDFYDELQEMIQFFKKNNYRMWVCDLSWLGFPTVMVYSPELQQYKFSIYDRVAFYDKRVFPGEKMRQFRKAMLDREESIFDPKYLENLKDPTFLYQNIFKRSESTGILRGLPHVGSKLAKFSAWKFLGLLSYYHKDFDLAKRYFTCALFDEPNNLEIQCKIDFLTNLTENDWIGDKIKPSMMEMRLNKLSHYPQDILYYTWNAFRTRDSAKRIISEYLVPCPYYKTSCLGCMHNAYCAYGKLFPIYQKLLINFPDKLYLCGDPIASP